MTRLIKVCPSCGSGAIHRRCRRAAGNEKYRCSACKKDFSLPGLKEINVDLNRRRLPNVFKRHLT